MADKQLPCCARRTGKLIQTQNDLRVFAQKAAFASSKNRDITRYQELIARAKKQIEMDKEAIADHEADHAAGTAA